MPYLPSLRVGPFGITKDLIEPVQGIITVGEFYAMAAGGRIIFT